MKNVGGFTWSGGVLRVPRAGVYSITAHAQFRSNDYQTVAIQVTQNADDPNTTSTVCAQELTVDSPPTDTNSSLGVTAVGNVPLNAGDVLRVLVLHRNRGSDSVNIGSRAYDLTWDVIWQDTL